MDDPRRVLLIEDNEGDARLVRELLRSAPELELAVADRLEEGLGRLTEDDVDVLLLDLGLPDSQGLATALEAMQKAPSVPVIVLTGNDDDMAAAEAIGHGAQDYLVKGDFTAATLRRAIRYAIERKRAETALRERDEELRESETRYRTLFEAAAEGITVVDSRTMEHLYVNSAVCRMFGYTHEEMKALRVPDVHPQGLRPQLAESFETLQKQKHERIAQVPCLHKDGSTFYADIAVTSMRIDGRMCNVAFFTDVTERVEAQQELKDVQEQLLLAQKMEAVGRLAGGVAHDFNNLLTGISGFAGFVRDRMEPGSQSYDDLTQVLALSERAAGLTRQLLAFSRRQRLEPIVLNLNTLIAEQSRMLRRLLGEDVDLRFTPAKGLGNVRVDPGQMEQVIMNLAVNARDAMPEGGRVSIETANVELGEDYARAHTGVTPGPYVMVAFSDTGTGMDGETLAHIFDPFFTTKGPGKGTGLGLSTAYGIVKQHDGNIWVYSEPGVGTTFKVYLPLVESGLQHRREPSHLIVGGSETILLVEDNAAVRDVGRRHLVGLGYNVLTAGSARQAQETAASYDGCIHLLLTDMVMPGLNGRELAESLTSSRPGLRVLFMSGHIDHSVIRDGALDESVPFLQKPFERHDLADKVRQALDLLAGT